MAISDAEARLQAVVASQERALAHWRSEADRDAGKIARYETAFRRIAGLPTQTAEAHTAANEAVAIAREAMEGGSK